MAGVTLGLIVGLFIYGLGINCAFVDNEINSEVGVSVRPTKLWKFLDKNNDVAVQRFKEAIDEFSVGDIRCLRYCIESKTSMNEMPSYLNLIWKLDNKNGIESTSVFDKDFKPEIIQGESRKSYDSNDTQGKCTFSIVIGCELSKTNGNNLEDVEKRFIKSLQSNIDIIEDSGDKDSPALNFLRERIIDEVDMRNETEVNFLMQPNQAELSIVIFGNITKIDLKMPIAPLRIKSRSATTTTKTLAAVAAPQLTLATTRMPGGATGVRLNVINPPPGGWRLQIQGVENQTYRLVAVQMVVPEFSNPSMDFDVGSETFSLDNLKNTSKMSDILSRRIKTLDEVKNVIESRIPNDSENKHVLSPRMMSVIESSAEQKNLESFKFPTEENERIVSFNLDKNITTRMDETDDGIESRIIDRKSIDLTDLSNPLNDELPIRKYLTVELNPKTELFAHALYHRLIFDITNNHVLRILHYLYPQSNPFPIYRSPQSLIIGPGQTVSVYIDISIPPTATDVINKVSLRVEGIDIVEKSVNFYVRSDGRINRYDDRSPDIDFYFNNNCHGRTSGEYCLKSFWSVDVIVQDYDSGLKSVVSSPKGIYPRTPYVSGTSSPVKFYYVNNCCNRKIEVTATDASGNVYSRTIDADVWYNLTTGEILAIIFITFFIILLIVFIVLLIIYCVRRKQSQDLPYSQRYGSRTSPQ